MSLYKCEDCKWSGSANELDLIDYVEERVNPGELMPLGECPQCSCLIDVADDDVPNYTLEIRIKIARDRGLLKEAV